jgi:hypothetical protein
MVMSPKKTVKKKKPKPVLPLHDERMLTFLDYLVSNLGYKSRTKALLKIGFTTPNTVYQVIAGLQSFRPVHFSKAIELFGVDANFFFKKDHTKMFYETEPKPVLTELMEIVSRVAVELNKK